MKNVKILGDNLKDWFLWRLNEPVGVFTNRGGRLRRLALLLKNTNNIWGLLIQTLSFNKYFTFNYGIGLVAKAIANVGEYFCDLLVA